MEITIRSTNHNKHDQQQNGVEAIQTRRIYIYIYAHTLWLFIVAIWKKAYLYMIYDDLPIKKCDFP